MIAEVIVDVAAHQTDRVFEYHIPDDLDVEIGSRVVVPFGRRKVQGFVVAVKKSSDFTGQLKDLLLVVDEMPPLTPELVALSSDPGPADFCLPDQYPQDHAAGCNAGQLPENPPAKQPAGRANASLCRRPGGSG